MTQPESQPGAGLDNRQAENQYRRMEDRLARIETDVATLKADVASLREHSATKEDLANVRDEIATANLRLSAEIAKSESRLYQAINAQTWRLVTWMTSAMALMTAAVYYLARNVH
jgi:septal ring factor EnvC (AmiA/AmiB activator)